MKSLHYFLLLFLFCACGAEEPSLPATEARTELEQLFDQIPANLKTVFTDANTSLCSEFALINQGEVKIENNTWNATNLATPPIS